MRGYFSVYVSLPQPGLMRVGASVQLDPSFSEVSVQGASMSRGAEVPACRWQGVRVHDA